MGRLLIDNDWFEEVSYSAIYEVEFERIIMDQSSQLFPQYFLIPFKVIVQSEYDTAKADFALIDEGYKRWWVVEVELADHSFFGHVVPQVRTLSRATYAEPEAAYLANKDGRVDYERLVDMMKGKQPKVLVIVNGERQSWSDHLKAYNASLMLFELYRSIKNKSAFKIKGGRLSEKTDVVSYCHLDQMLPRYLKVDSPSALGIRPNEPVEILFEDQVSTWMRVDSSDTVWLCPNGVYPLPQAKRYSLVRLSDGNLRFEI